MRPRRRRSAQEPPPIFPATPGTAGRLEFRADIPGEGRAAGEGEYVYVGPLDITEGGMLAFAPARPLYLHPDEVVSFVPTREENR